MPSTNANSYKALVVWQKGMGLAKLVYQLTDTFPASEKYGLVAQMCRAGVSVPSNIAEGQARRSIIGGNSFSLSRMRKVLRRSWRRN